MEDIQLLTFGELLKAFRTQRKMTQQELATRIGAHRNTIGSWERGDVLPESKTTVLEVAHQLRLELQETRRLLEASLTALSPYWLMPSPRNPFFTGREEVLRQLHDALTHEHSAVLSQSYALSGLGGIGKTQTAIEYAYRYAQDYAAVLWISAETMEIVISSIISIATMLNLPEKQEQDQEKVVAAVIRWLTSHSDWLLILDNVEDPALVKRFLPPARSGSLLFTSRRQSLGLPAQIMDLEHMTLEEGMRFLLHRARLLDLEAPLDHLPPIDRACAREIVVAMDGLPLALDQAGAYIEATRCHLSDYLHLFRSSHLRLLDERNAHLDHPLSVTGTFALAFEQLEQKNTAAAELLTVCAFLAPEAIPETFFIEGATYLGPTFERLAGEPFEFHAAFEALLTYSLIQRHAATGTVTIHRLVQAVLKGRLTEASQRIWVRRVIGAMGQLFPTDNRQANYWPICEQLLSHAQECLRLGDQWSEDETLCLPLMSHVATYLFNRGRSTEAEAFFERAISLGEQALGSQHLLMAEALYGLGELYRQYGKYAEAESLFRRVLCIREQALGAVHPLVAKTLGQLGVLYYRRGKYEQAESFYQHALHIFEQALDLKHLEVATPLNNLGILYEDQGKYEQAELCYQRALHIWEQALGSENYGVGPALINLGGLYTLQGKYEQAELYLQRALSLFEQTFGREHPDVAYPLHSLGELYFEQGNYEQAESYYQRALSLFEQALGPEHLQVATSLTSMGELYFRQGNYEQAESYYQRILHICEQTLGLEHPLFAEALNGLANLYREQGKYGQARPLYQRALTLRQKHLNSPHPQVADTLYDLARFHQMQQHSIEALSLYQQALTIREQALGLDHPKTKQTRTDYVHLLEEVKREEGKISNASNQEALSVEP